MMADEDWEEEVIKVLLAGLDGRAKLAKVRTSLSHRKLLVGTGIEEALKRMSDSSRFLVFQKYQSVKYISVFCQDASICFAFRKRGYEKCINRNCSKFHVCKYFISGNCTKSSNCRFGHDLQNETNRKVSERLGLSSFSADELHTIISRSNPAVCMKHNTRGCDDDDCPDLHICSRFILQRCTAGAGCRFGHSFLASDHNEWVLDTFNVSYLREEELRRIILVRGIVDAAKMTPATSSLSLYSNYTATSSLSLYSNYTATSSTSLAEEDTDEYVTRVFRFLLFVLGGRAQFNTFLTERGRHLQFMRKANIVSWLKDHMDRFILFERAGDVEYVSVYNRQAKVCFGYNSSGCNNKSCKFFHVCKRFVAGNCVQTSCPLSHSFSSEPNAKAYSLLKLDHFTNNEIRKIFFYSNPVVCDYYNRSGVCGGFCMDLHVCAKDLLRLCTSGVDCKFGHVMRDSGEHNSYVLKTFRVDTLDEHNLRRLVIIKSDYLYTSEGATTPSSQSSSTGGQLADNNKSLELPTSVSVKADTVPMKYEYICETYTCTGACPNSPDCPRYHNPDRLPYLWLIVEDEEWVRIPATFTIDLETCFCDLGDVLNKKFSIRGIEHMDFNTMSAISDGTTFKLKRLSTPSYVTATPGTPLSFYTQWVWYRQERDGTYPPFYPGSLQYTLEEKYLKGQHKYYFEFEDLRLMVDTHSLPMTQTNLHTQGCTLICRRPVFEPTKKSEVPKMSSLLLAEVPSVVHQVPKHWSAVDHFQDFELVELESADPEYITVQRQFFSTMSMTEQKIVHVFRVQNPGLWDKYCSAKRAMTPRGQRPEEVDERQLFHGTPTLQAARGICANSFDFRRSGENVGAIHGKGAYFSTTARYSHSYTRVHTTVTGDPLRFMFLGRILVGQYTLGDPSYTKPPERDRLKLYDSCVNDLSNPSIFVIFDLAQSYPEYLIQYTDVSGKKQQSQVRTSASVPSLAQTQPSVSPLSRQSSLKMSTVAPSTVNSNRFSWSNLLSTPSSSLPSSGSSTNISAGITSTLSSVGSPSTATSPSFTTSTGYPHLVTSTGIHSSSTAFPSASASKKAISSSTSSGPLPTLASSGPVPTSTSTRQFPASASTGSLPYPSPSKPLPTSTSTGQLSSTTFSRPLPISTSLGPLPTTSYSKPHPTSSSTAPLPISTSSGLLHATSSSKLLPTSTATGTFPTSTSTGPLPTSTSTGAFSTSTSSGSLLGTTSLGLVTTSPSSGPLPAASSSKPHRTPTSTEPLPSSTSSGPLPTPTSIGIFSTSTSTGPLPFSTSSGQLPASYSSKPPPTSTSSGSPFSYTSTAPLPISTSSGLLPGISSSKLLPTSTSTGPLPSSTSTGPLPTTSSLKPLPTSTSTGPLPTTSSSKPLPTSTSTGPLPSSTSTGPLPTTSSSKPLPTSTSTGPLPTTSSSKPLPTSTSSGPLPTSTSIVPLPTSTSTGPLPSYTSTAPLPTTSSSKPLPTSTSSGSLLSTTSLGPVTTSTSTGSSRSSARQPCTTVPVLQPTMSPARQSPTAAPSHQPSAVVPVQTASPTAHRPTTIGPAHQSVSHQSTTSPPVKPVSHQSTTSPPVQPVSHQSTTSPPVKPVSHQSTTSLSVQPVSHQSTTSPPVQPVSHQSTTSPPVKPVSHQSTTSPPVQPVSHQSTTSPPVKPVSHQSTTSLSVQPVSHQSTTSPPVQPVSHQSTTSPPVKPVSHQSTTSPPVQPVSHQSTTSPPVKPVSHQSTTSPPVQAVSHQSTTSPPVKPVSHQSTTSPPVQPVSHQSTTSPSVQPVSHQSTTSLSVQPVSHQSTTSLSVQPVSHQSTTLPPVQPRSRSSQLTSAQSVSGRTPQTLTSSPYMGGPSGFLQLSLNDDPTSFAALDTFTNVSLSTWQDQSSSPATKPRDKDRCVIA